jgi:hypothetical protein
MPFVPSGPGSFSRYYSRWPVEYPDYVKTERQIYLHLSSIMDAFGKRAPEWCSPPLTNEDYPFTFDEDVDDYKMISIYLKIMEDARLSRDRPWDVIIPDGRVREPTVRFRFSNQLDAAYVRLIT